MQVVCDKARIVVIGECLLELSGPPFGTLQQAFGGDTLNTALYLARLAHRNVVTHYVTALGVDPLSDAMLARWRAEGIDVSFTLRDGARLPGQYQIQVDARGERSFLYWRGASAARYLVQHPDFGRVQQVLGEVDLVYLSAISLAILPARDRTRLVALLASLAARGLRIAFDTNYRPLLWSDAHAARTCIAAMLPATKLLFATFDDENALWGDATPQATLDRYRAAGVPLTTVKLGAGGCLYGDAAGIAAVPTVPVEHVVDTTAAGDAFNAAWLAAHLAGAAVPDCCRAGHALAGIVIRHRGAIIPAGAMPSLQALLPSGGVHAAH